MKLKLICPDGDPEKFEVVTQDGERVERVTRISASRDLDESDILAVSMDFLVYEDPEPKVRP